MTQPKYRLIYFNFRGKGEPLRWMFAYAGVPFEDYRFTESPSYHPGASEAPTPTWLEFKKTLPFQLMPVLEVDGKLLAEQHAIARYLAKQFRLTGKNDWEEAQADAIATYLAGTDVAFMTYFREKDETLKKHLKDKLDVAVGATAEKLESILKANKDGSGYFIGDSPTIADFLTAGFFDQMCRVLPGSMAPYTVWEAHRNRIHQLPGVKEFIAKYANT